jgi:glyoxylase-like metal-dependent hydrolase (beta-lactamase superfamily II)
MRFHHLNCISSCPLGGSLMDGRSVRSLRGRLVCHCVLVEAADQLVLIDTGFGLRDVADPPSRLSRVMLELMRPEFRADMTAIRQIQRLGLDPRDVRHIVLTHLDFDHAGGLDDFPLARVHMLAAERDRARARPGVIDRMRYRPQQWSTRDNWRVYPQGTGEHWFGFECVRELVGLPPELLLVPLTGHTLGHAGIAMKRAGGDWLLHAGDAYFYYTEMDADHPRCTPGLAAYQRLMDQDHKARVRNQQRLRELRRAHAAEITLFSAHDTHEFERLAGHAPEWPAARRREVVRPAAARPEPIPVPPILRPIDGGADQRLH